MAPDISFSTLDRHSCIIIIFVQYKEGLSFVVCGQNRMHGSGEQKNVPAHNRDFSFPISFFFPFILEQVRLRNFWFSCFTCLLFGVVISS